MYNMPTSFEIGIVPGFRLRLGSLDRFRRSNPLPPQFSISDPQKFLPLANVPLNPILSATWKVEIRHLSICLPLFPA